MKCKSKKKIFTKKVRMERRQEKQVKETYGLVKGVYFTSILVKRIYFLNNENLT